MADIKESNDPQLSGGCKTVLQLLQERRHVAAECHNHIVFLKNNVVEIKHRSVILFKNVRSREPYQNMSLMRLMGNLSLKSAQNVYDKYAYDMAQLFSNDFISQ